MVNFVCSHGLNQYQLHEFLVDTEYPVWLSSGKILLQFFELRAEIGIFLSKEDGSHHYYQILIGFGT